MVAPQHRLQLHLHLSQNQLLLLLPQPLPQPLPRLLPRPLQRLLLQPLQHLSLLLLVRMGVSSQPLMRKSLPRSLASICLPSEGLVPTAELLRLMSRWPSLEAVPQRLPPLPLPLLLLLLPPLQAVHL